MGYQTVVEGDASNIPDVALNSGAYRLTLWAPVEIPQWILDLIYNALRTAGVAVRAVRSSGNGLVVDFDV